MNYNFLQDKFRCVLESNRDLRNGFRERGLMDFYINDGPSTNDPKLYASYILKYFCYENSKQNEFFRSGAMAIMIFLNEFNFSQGSIFRSISEIHRTKEIAKTEEIYLIFDKYLALLG